MVVVVVEVMGLVVVGVDFDDGEFVDDIGVVGLVVGDGGLGSWMWSRYPFSNDMNIDIKPCRNRRTCRSVMLLLSLLLYISSIKTSLKLHSDSVSDIGMNSLSSL